MKLSTKIQATTASLHNGQTGTVVADYGTMYMVKADDEEYSRAFKSSGLEGKYFQVDSRKVKVIHAKD